MAFIRTPTSWITGFSSASSNITMPQSQFPDITDYTDIRDIFQGFCEKMYQEQVHQATLTNVSTKMSITKNITTNVSTNENTLFYTFSFICAGQTNNVPVSE
jgi:hypothetical protein